MLAVAISISPTMIGQALIAVMIAVIGWVLNHKSKQIHVLVNSRLTDALARIAALEVALNLGPGDPIPSKPQE